jgi:hypothetical protein
MHPWRRWKEVAEDDSWGPQRQAGGHPPEGSGASLRAGVFCCLPDSSRVVFVEGKFRLFMQLNPPLYAFWNNP